MKKTHQPKSKRRKKAVGFRKRMSTAGGKNVLKRKRNRGRKKIAG